MFKRAQMMKRILEKSSNVKKQPLKEYKWSKGMFIGAQMTKKIFKGSLMRKNNVSGSPNDEK